MSDFDIYELTEQDWREYKSIRLKSLYDSPDSFGSTSEREACFTVDQWKARLAASSSSNSALTIAAVADKRYVGLLSGVIHATDSSADLYQMWVDPDCRGMGVGTALVDTVRRWAVDKGVSKLVLSVTTINLQAISLYKSIGFIPVGLTEPLRIGSDLQSQAMELKLATDRV